MSTAARAWRSGKSDWRLYSLSIFSLAVAFICLATALLVVVNVHAVRERWAQTGRASVYLRDSVADGALASLKSALTETAGVTSMRYVSSEDARKEILAGGLGDSLAPLPSDVFPASIELTLSPQVADDALAAIAIKLRALPSVESVETYERWTEKLASVLRSVVTASAVLAIVVLGAVISVVGSTMRLALHRRRIEVEVMKLVGATNAFVRGPFVVEGAAQGALGAAFSLLILGTLYLLGRGHLDGDVAGMLGFTPVFLPFELSAAMIVMGGLLGALAAFAGIRRHLTV